MARQAKRIECSNSDKSKLLEMSGSRKIESALALRAKIVLRCLEGKLVRETAEICGVTRETVIIWRDRFMAGGIKGLCDKPRSGRPAIYKEQFKKDVLKKLEQPPPEGHGQWDGSLLAQELGYSKHAIWRLLKRQRICLARKRTWCISTDPEFAAKAADIVGLYLSKDEKVIVVCVDEKPNIQALERRTGYAVSSSRKLVKGMESTYKRNGTLNLYAALEIATGKVHGRVTDSSQKTKKGFLEFMEGLLIELPDAGEYHVIVDNHSIHKRHDDWLEKHRNVFFHYTPTSASWMNMVEIWFGMLTRKSLQGMSFTSTGELRAHIEKFISAYNSNASPFTWRKRDVKGAQLSRRTDNFCN